MWMRGQRQTGGQVADAYRGNWVDRRAPPASRPYLRLSRADRPIGTWLLLIPCWWGVLLAAASTGRFGWREAWVMLGCAAGAWLMRGAGCTWNDITDRDFDAAVARTRSRPIPSGQVTARQAALWMAAQSLVAFAHPAHLSPAGDRPRDRLAGAGRDLSLRQAVHLVAAGVPRPRLQLGRAAGLGRASPAPSRRRRSRSMPRASPGRSSTTRSTPTRTRRTTC